MPNIGPLLHSNFGQTGTQIYQQGLLAGGYYFPAAIRLAAGSAVALLSFAADGDFMLKLAAVATGTAAAFTGSSHIPGCIAFTPVNCFTDRCRRGMHLCGFVLALLLLIEIVQQFHGDGGEGQPLVGIVVVEVVAVALIQVTVGADNHNIAVTPDAVTRDVVAVTMMNDG